MSYAFRKVATAAAVFLCLSSAVSTASAQSAAAAAAAARDPEYQALFKRMYNNPQDMEVTFKFAEVATRLGDYEAAIGALERVLLYNPNLARVKVELAILYQRVGGTQVATSYLEQAIATPGVPPEVRAAAQQLLVSGVTPGDGAPNKFSLFAHYGMRYQTNASAGPTSSLIRSFGDVTSLDRQFGRAPDWNHFILTNAGYTHDIAPGVAAEFGFFGYYAKQVNLWRFDTGLVEFQAGPRFNIPSDLVSDLSVKPYAIGTAAWLAADPYYSGPGVGVSSRFTAANTRFEPAYEYRDREFTNSEFYPTVSQQSGKLHVAGLTGDGKIFNQAWTGRLAAGWNRSDNPRFSFNSYDRLTGDIAFPMPFTVAFWDAQRQFVFTPTAGFSMTDFAQPNPSIDRNIVREDREWRVGAALDMQVYEAWGIRTHLQYAEVVSNLPNFDMKNLSISFGPTYRF